MLLRVDYKVWRRRRVRQRQGYLIVLTPKTDCLIYVQNAEECCRVPGPSFNLLGRSGPVMSIYGNNISKF